MIETTLTKKQTHVHFSSLRNRVRARTRNLSKNKNDDTNLVAYRYFESSVICICPSSHRSGSIQGTPPPNRGELTIEIMFSLFEESLHLVHHLIFTPILESK